MRKPQKPLEGETVVATVERRGLGYTGYILAGQRIHRAGWRPISDQAMRLAQTMKKRMLLDAESR